MGHDRKIWSSGQGCLRWSDRSSLSGPYLRRAYLRHGYAGNRAPQTSEPVISRASISHAAASAGNGPYQGSTRGFWEATSTLEATLRTPSASGGSRLGSPPREFGCRADCRPIPRSPPERRGTVLLSRIHLPTWLLR